MWVTDKNMILQVYHMIVNQDNLSFSFREHPTLFGCLKGLSDSGANSSFGGILCWKLGWEKTEVNEQ